MSNTSKLNVDLSGTWRLNLAKSFLGNEHPAPGYELVWKLEQSGHGILMTEIARNRSIVNIPLPNSTQTTEYVLDGRERNVVRPGIFPGMPKRTIGIRSEWQGGTVWIEERSEPNSNNFISHRRIFLSEDSSHLIEIYTTQAIFGDSEQRRVFERVR